jgi:hypothetical protein
VQATQRHTSPQPPSNGDRISLLRLAEQVSRNTGPILAAEAIREKSLAGDLRIWVQWFWLARVTSGEAFVSLGEETAPPSFLHDLEQRGLRTPPSFLHDLDPLGLMATPQRGLTFRTIINASESGLYLDPDAEADWPAALLFASRAEAAQFWPWLETVDKIKAPNGRRSTRGPNFAYDWEAAAIEAAAYILEHDLPEEQADLVTHIAQWFGDDGPGETQIKAHIAPLYRKAKRALGR